jgi:hypothetical protein
MSGELDNVDFGDDLQPPLPPAGDFQLMPDRGRFWTWALEPFHGITQYGHEEDAGRAAVRVAIEILTRVLHVPPDWEREDKPQEVRRAMKIPPEYSDAWSLDWLQHGLRNQEIPHNQDFEGAVLVFLLRLMREEAR